jgi:hypothetical protein
LPIHPDDRHKTAFVVPGGLYEWKVIPFGLANAPAAFMRHMNKILRPHAKYAVVYLDDVLIHSRTFAEHDEHVLAVLDSIRKARLKLEASKCEFGVEETTFVGFRVNADGIHTMEKKVQAVAGWPVPESVRDLRGFLGLAGYYRKFVDRFAHRAHRLYDLANDPDARKSPAAFRAKWAQREPELTEQMNDLKRALTTAPVLATLDPARDFVLRTDASDTAIGGVLAQRQLWNGREVERPLGYFSRKLTATETRYFTYDRELLAIHENLVHWSCYVHCRKKTTIYTDHASLQHILQQAKLSGRQWRHLALLQQHDYEIKYFPGAANIVADALSRRTHKPSKLDELPPSLNLDAFEMTATSAAAWVAELKSELAKDAHFGEILKVLQRHLLPPDATAAVKKARVKAVQRARLFSLEDNGLLYHRSRRTLCIPRSLCSEILREAHDTPTGGHFGVEKTLAQLVERFYWPRMKQSVVRWVGGCAVCHRVKPSNHLPYGLLQPLDIPSERWNRINIDFITKLPASADGTDTIVTIVDPLTKRAHWFPATEAGLTAESFAEMFLREHVRLHGIPASIVSDRDARFTADFWRALMDILGTKLRMSTAFHPQTDGQAEKANSIVGTYLRAFAADHPDRWPSLLSLAEYAYNAAKHKSTKLTPFEADLGYTPRLPIDVIAQQNTPAHAEARSFVERMRAVLVQLRESLEQAQSAQVHEANRHRIQHDFKPGDKVMIDTSKLPVQYVNLSKTSSRKLQHKYAGPFVLGRQYGENAFEVVDIPRAWQVHSTFNVSRFKHCRIDESRPQKPPPALLSSVRGQQFEVEAIRAHSGSTVRDFRYELKWKGYPEDENTWEPLANLKTTSTELLREYHEAQGLRIYAWMTAPRV